MEYHHFWACKDNFGHECIRFLPLNLDYALKKKSSCLDGKCVNVSVINCPNFKFQLDSNAFICFRALLKANFFAQFTKEVQKSIFV